MEFRLASKADEAAVKWLWAYCFENYEPFFSWYFTEYYRAENTLVGLNASGRLQTCLQLIPYQLALRRKTVASSYIVGVATYPEARSGGMIKPLLTASLAEMRRREHFVSLLMPFRAGFYYPYGWEFCYHHLKYSVNLADLRHIAAADGELRLIADMQDIASLQEVYQQFTAGRHGYVVREQRNWQNLLQSYFDEKGFVYLLEAEHRPQGYVMYKLQDGQINVLEMAYVDIQAERALLQFLYNHRSQAEQLEWNAPIDDLMHFALPDHRQGIQLYPFLMARIVDVAGILATIAYPRLTATVTISVSDDLAPWNNQSFKLMVNNGVPHVTVLGSAAAEVQCSIGSLTQLVFGRLSAHALAAAGKLAAQPDALAVLAALLPPCTNYINEYY